MGLRTAPWVRRWALTVADRNEIAELDPDLDTYLVPWPPNWGTPRTWRCRITRGEVVVANTEGHDHPMDAFHQARAMLERRVSA